MIFIIQFNIRIRLLTSGFTIRIENVKGNSAIVSSYVLYYNTMTLIISL